MWHSVSHSMSHLRCATFKMPQFNATFTCDICMCHPCHIGCGIGRMLQLHPTRSMPHSLATSACAIHVTLDVTLAECCSYTQHAKKQKKKKWKKREKQNKTNLCPQQGLNPGHTGKKAIDGCLDQTGTAKCWRQSSERTDDRIIEISGITTQGASTPKKTEKEKGKKRERERSRIKKTCAHTRDWTRVRKPQAAVQTELEHQMLETEHWENWWQLDRNFSV